MRSQRAYGRFVRVGSAVGVALSATAFAARAGAVTTIACIGEQTTSTTEGATAAQLWPAVLGTKLGASYTVSNDVTTNANYVLAATTSADYPVTAASKAGPPDIVIIGPFAEHDAGAVPAATEAQFQAAYLAIVNVYLGLTPAPKVYVMTPPPEAFVYQGAAEQTFAADVVEPAVLAVAQAKNLKVIDLFDDTALASGGDMGGDGHFSPTGMIEVAQLAYEAITGTGGSDAGGSSGVATSGSSGSGSGVSTSGSSGVISSGVSTSGSSGVISSGVSTSGSSGAISSGSSGASTGAGSGTEGSGSSTPGGSGTEPGSAGSGTSESGSSPGGGSGGGGTEGSQPSNTSGCAVSTTGRAANLGAMGSLLVVALAFVRRRRARS